MATSKQYDLSGQSPPEDHLRLEPSPQSGTQLQADVDRMEFFCSECGYRVTVNSKNRTEYGHEEDCEYHLHVGDES